MDNFVMLPTEQRLLLLVPEGNELRFELRSFLFFASRLARARTWYKRGSEWYELGARSWAPQ